MSNNRLQSVKEFLGTGGAEIIGAPVAFLGGVALERTVCGTAVTGLIVGTLLLVEGARMQYPNSSSTTSFDEQAPQTPIEQLVIIC